VLQALPTSGLNFGGLYWTPAAAYIIDYVGWRWCSWYIAMTFAVLIVFTFVVCYCFGGYLYLPRP